MKTENKVTWDQKISDKVQSLKPSGIRVFFDIVSQKKDVISLGVGEPDFVSPPSVLEAGIEAIRNGYTHYTGNQGIPSLRKSISRYLENEYGIEYDYDKEILITVGVSQGKDLALRAALNPGDEVLYSSPSYVSYEPLIELAGGKAVKVPVQFENNFQLNIDELEKKTNSKTKILFLNYPANPTGNSYEAEKLEQIRQFVLKHDLIVISDEIYGELSYSEKHIPFASLPGMKERTLTLGGFSKTYAMTGWRIGYAAGPTEWVFSMMKIHQYSMLSVPTIAQMAAEAALKYSQKERFRMKDAYEERKDKIVSGLNAIGLETLNPDGTFYVFPSIKNTKYDSLNFAEKLLEDKNVAIVPGTAFGEEGEGFFRASFATSMKEIEEAVSRMEAFLSP